MVIKGLFSTAFPIALFAFLSVAERVFHCGGHVSSFSLLYVSLSSRPAAENVRVLSMDMMSPKWSPLFSFC
jgi:hypothetical protein